MDIIRSFAWNQGSRVSLVQEIDHKMETQVRLNDRYIVSAGSDKVVVIWDAGTGEKIIKFGQQTNICAGIHLYETSVAAISVDGVINVFDAVSREMVGQFKISELKCGIDQSEERGRDIEARLKKIGPITWVKGDGGVLVVSMLLSR